MCGCVGGWPCITHPVLCRAAATDNDVMQVWCRRARVVCAVACVCMLLTRCWLGFCYGVRCPACDCRAEARLGRYAALRLARHRVPPESPPTHAAMRSTGGVCCEQVRRQTREARRKRRESRLQRGVQRRDHETPQQFEKRQARFERHAQRHRAGKERRARRQEARAQRRQRYVPHDACRRACGCVYVDARVCTPAAARSVGGVARATMALMAAAPLAPAPPVTGQSATSAAVFCASPGRSKQSTPLKQQLQHLAHVIMM